MNQFGKLGISPSILSALDEIGITVPMPVQDAVIPKMLDHDHDLVALAQTGTGKTAAFGLPLLEKIHRHPSNRTEVLVLAPTRELAVQIKEELDRYGKHLPEFQTAVVYGGVSIELQIKALRKKPQIIVATPGRLLDILQRKKADLSNIHTLILDEADEMLNMGFEEELTNILTYTPPEKRVCLFSATMPKAVSDIASNYMSDPEEIAIGHKNAGAEHVNHIYYMISAKDRFKALKRLVDFHPSIYGIIFCRTRMETKEIADMLMSDGYQVDALHGDLSQAQREYVMHRFRKKHLKLIVATDVAARGLDIDELTHVINYNLPDELQIYTHRSGRTGRAGKKGCSLSIIHRKERYKIQKLEKLLRKKFDAGTIPNGEEVCEKQLFNFIDRMEKSEVDEDQISPYIEKIERKLEWMDKRLIIKQFVALEFNRFLQVYRDAEDLNADDAEKVKFKKKRDKNIAYTRFFIKIGKRESISPEGIIGLINDLTGNRDIRIGKIDIYKTFTFFETESAATDTIIKSFLGQSYKKKPFLIEIATPESPSLGKGKKVKKNRGSGRRKPKK